MNYGLIGEKLGHSFSKEIHLRFNKYDYELVELKNEELESFFQKKEFKGINVTIPYKEKIITFLDEVSLLAQKIGAVNTVVNKEGKLFGYNTDYYGFNYTLKCAGIEINGKVVAILGSGGASKTVKTVVFDLGAKEIITVSRSGEYNYQTLKSRTDVQVIINATPVGMYPNNGECMVCLDHFPNLESVVDLVYNPSVTELLYRANEKGVKSINGLPMLVAQAKRACELFSEQVVDDKLTEKIIRAVKSETLNITLVGMPGSGKTSVGKYLATAFGREFIDTDQEFFSTYQLTAGEYIKTYGEKAFREKEEEIVAKVSKQSKKVIATGGGAVIRANNRKNLSSNSVVVWVKRELAELAVEDRPLSLGEDKLRTLFLERSPLYSSVSNIELENNGDLESVCRRALEKINEYYGEKL